MVKQSPEIQERGGAKVESNHPGIYCRIQKKVTRSANTEGSGEGGEGVKCEHFYCDSWV
jgi:hypothetical protein